MSLTSLRKHPFLLALRRWGRFARKNVPSGEERGETDVFAGWSLTFLTYVGREFQSFAAKNENDLWRHHLK